MGEKGRELYGLGEIPSNSLATIFEVAIVNGAATTDRVAVAAVIGVWVQ